MDSAHSGIWSRRNTWFKEGRGFLTRHGEPIVLGLLIVFVSLVQVAWILQDTRPQPGADPNHYLIKTFEFVATLKDQEGTQWWQSIPQLSLQGRPPLYQLASIPFIYLFGRSEDAALTINVVLEVILLLATYAIGKQAVDRKTGLIAALLVAAYPPIIGLSTIYRPHAALPAWVALNVWLLLRLMENRSMMGAWLFGGALGLGMLIHLNFLYLMLGPAILFGVYMLLFQTRPYCLVGIKELPHWLGMKLRDPFVLFGLLPAALIPLGLAASWYLPQSQALLALQQAVSENWVGEAYGFRDVPPSFWWYALTAPGAISYVLSAFLGLGLMMAVLRRGRGSLILLAVFITMYVSIGSRLGDKAWLHFAPVLPVAAALTASGLADIHSWLAARRWFGRLLPTALTLTCLSAAALVFSTVTWGSGPWGPRITEWLGAPLNTGICQRRMNLAFCPNPPRSENWQVSNILQVLLDDPACQESGCHLVVVPKVDNIDSFVFDYYLLRDFPEFRPKVRVTTADGWGGKGADGEWVVSDYLLYIQDPNALGMDRGKAIRAAVSTFLQAPAPTFAGLHQQVASFSLPPGWIARLVKRTKPLTMDATIQIYEEALASVQLDPGLYEKLGYLHLWAGNWSKAEALFLQAIDMESDPGWAHCALGDLYRRQGLPDQAVVEFEQAIKREPYAPNAYRQLADLFVTQGNFGAATQTYRLAVQNSPGLVWPYLELGSLYVQENQLDEARSAYQNASRIEPWNPTARANRLEPFWSLASSLGATQAYAQDVPLIWWRGEAWVRPYPRAPDVMVGRSALEVEGVVRPDQIFLHPFAADQGTYLRFNVNDCHYDSLQFGYGLADQVAGLSDGLDYTLQASTDGGVSYTELWHATVTDNKWLSYTFPLMAYWGQDMTLQVVADARGDDSYDWLQTTIRFFAVPDVWKLGANLASVKATSTLVPLSWNGSSAWVDEAGRSLAAISQAPVQGTTRENQFQLHPAGSDQDSVLTFVVQNNRYNSLITNYALADEAIGRSNGVNYAISISTDGGMTYKTLLEKAVSENVWNATMIDLGAYLNRNLVIKLVSSSRGSDDYDWLQITLDLIAARV